MSSVENHDWADAIYLPSFKDDEGELWLSASTDIFKDKPSGGHAQEPSLKVLFTEVRRPKEAIMVECLSQSLPEYTRLL